MGTPSEGLTLTDALRGEHGAFYALFDLIESMAATEEAAPLLRGAGTVLRAMVEAHAGLEDAILFPALEPFIGGAQGPLAVMRAEHDDLEKRLGEIEDAEDAEHALGLVEDTLVLARRHFHKEEQVLFPMAEQFLPRAELLRLGREWAARRKVIVA